MARSRWSVHLVLVKGTQLELEFLAQEVRRIAGLGDDENALATTIATRVLGTDGVALDPQLQGPAYLRRRVDGGYQIVVRPTTPDMRFALMHEMGHYAIREIAHVTLGAVDEERAANYLAAAILAPADTLRRAYVFYGEGLRRLRPLAKAFGMSQTSMHLRLAEVLGDGRAIVTANNNNILSRGATWITIPVLKLASGETRRPDVQKATLHGGIDEGRIALRVR